MDDIEMRRERAARNQSLFREVNERIASLSRRFEAELMPTSYICECLDTACTALLELPFGEYERLRAQGRFFVLPGHEDPAVEVVVQATDRYLVVEKIGAGVEIADALNPRKVRAVS